MIDLCDNISSYVPLISFRLSTQKRISRDFITPKINTFFEVHGIKDPQLIETRCILSEKDFSHIPFTYFYNELFCNITKDSSGKVKIRVRYAIVFDKRHAKDYCEKSHLYYDYYEINGYRFFYYIFFELQEILEFCHSSNYDPPDYNKRETR